MMQNGLLRPEEHLIKAYKCNIMQNARISVIRTQLTSRSTEDASCMGGGIRCQPPSLVRLVLRAAAVVAFYCVLTVIYFHHQQHHAHHRQEVPQGVETVEIFSVTAQRANTSDIGHSRTVKEDVSTGIVEPGVPVCTDPQLLLVVYVHSAVTHFVRRAIIRSTWGNPQLYQPVRMQVVFMLGRLDPSANHFSQAEVLSEMQIHQDTVLLPHVDTYWNITEKAVGSLKYLTQHCSHVPFVLKVDDDFVVNMFSVIRLLINIKRGKQKVYPKADLAADVHVSGPPVSAQHLLMCFLWTQVKPIRDPKNKWYISEKEYPDPKYPDFCSGSAWIMSIYTVTQLHKSSGVTKLRRFDDLFITGFAREAAGIQALQIQHHYNLFSLRNSKTPLMEDFMQDVVFVQSATYSQSLRVWNAIITGPQVDIRPVRPT